MVAPSSPAARLEGKTLDSGWHVVKRLEDYPGRTGGCFSCSYIVQKGGHEAFLKALDYSQATEISRQLGLDLPSALQMLIQAYNFERGLLKQCAERRMDRVITALEDGSVRVDDDTFGIVNYLIFEPADGDVRRHLSTAQSIEVAWKLRSLHHVATGLNQLHSAGVAHQDLKPSNVLVFDDSASKVADLGCASVKGIECPRDGFGFAGYTVTVTPNGLGVARPVTSIILAVWRCFFSAASERPR